MNPQEQTLPNSQIVFALSELAAAVHQVNVDNGWWEAERNDGECIALMHSELSEALEGVRHNNPPSEHIPAFSAVEEEMADTVIRVLDYCHGKNHRLGLAIIAKLAYNRTRGYHHGGKTI